MNDSSSPIVKHLSQIPAQSAQRAGLRDTVLNSTGELMNQYEFGEQPHPLSDSSNQQYAAATEHPIQVRAQHIPIITGNNKSRSGGSLVAEAMANQSWSDGNDVATTNYQVDSPTSNNHVKHPEEELTRERSLASQLDNTHLSRTAIRPYDTQPQHYSTSAIPLLPHHTPPAHEATAAEIALGISPPFFSRHENRMEMVHDSRYRHRMRHQSEDIGDKAADISTVIESLSEVKDRDEENTSRTSETGVVTSPGRMTPLNDSSEHGPSDNPRFGAMGIGTPSTVSTAPSTDDASLGTDYRLDDSHLPNLLQGTPGHSRSQSWGDEGLLPGGNPYMPQLQEGQWMQAPLNSQFPIGQHTRWSTEGQPHRIATFREIAQSATREQAWSSPHYVQQHPVHRRYEQQGTLGGHQSHQEMRQPSTNPHQQYAGYQQATRRLNSGLQHTAPSLVATPPRPRPNSRQLGPPGPPSHRPQQPGGNVGSPHQTGSNTSRSSSEILKTLLRKKACLYEPDTSRSVALVTWLVGRELALEYGFFSRQQLQSGVHACVSDKIEAGIITRTKVNRCMQIILNSCFHYIIPRSDGTEEKGDVFRVSFAHTVQDDSFLLGHLPVPWNNLEVNREAILLASMVEDEERNNSKAVVTPKSSPRLSSTNPPLSPGAKDIDDVDSKRAVLLCFNENVRSAEDVFRCHNEFIRDTANAAQLQLTAQEWRSFFGREAARAPYLWGNIGIPIPSAEATGGTSRQLDALGQMSEDELSKFRTTWCAKRYDHDHDLCGFAHVEVSGGWLRRNPSLQHYEDHMCPFVFSTAEKSISPHNFFVNECPRGIYCDKSHSMEEILYHPRRYKSKNCTASHSRLGWCQLGDVCPNVHQGESARPSKKSGESRGHQARHPKKTDQATSTGAKSGSGLLPCAPMIYASPAPISSFERHLGMPGLQCLFRRNCSVIRAHVRNTRECFCVYNCFGDDFGIDDALAVRTRSGLPNPRASLRTTG